MRKRLCPFPCVATTSPEPSSSSRGRTAVQAFRAFRGTHRHKVMVRLAQSGLLLALVLPATADARPGVPTAANFCKLKAGTIDKPGSYARTAIYRMGRPDGDYRRLPANSELEPQLQWRTRRFEFTAVLTSGGTRILSLDITRRGRWKPPCDETRGNEIPTPELPEPPKPPEND